MSGRVGGRRGRPALWLDLPVLLLMLGCWAVVALAGWHIALGLVLAAMIGVPLQTRPGGWRWLGAYPRRIGPLARKLLQVALLLSTLAMLATGVLRWWGLGAGVTGHAVAGYAFLILGAAHLLLVLSRLRRRLTRR